MPKFTILRRGSNAANQPRTLGWVPVEILDANNSDDSLDRASMTCYANQVLRAEPEANFPRQYRRSPYDGSYFER